MVTDALVFTKLAGVMLMTVVPLVMINLAAYGCELDEDAWFFPVLTCVAAFVVCAAGFYIVFVLEVA